MLLIYVAVIPLSVIDTTWQSYFYVPYLPKYKAGFFSFHSLKDCGAMVLHNGYRVPFPGVKRLGHGIDQPLPSSAKVKEIVELYFHSSSLPSCHVVGRTLPLPSHNYPQNYKCCMLAYFLENRKGVFLYLGVWCLFNDIVSNTVCVVLNGRIINEC